MTSTPPPARACGRMRSLLGRLPGLQDDDDVEQRGRDEHEQDGGEEEAEAEARGEAVLRGAAHRAAERGSRRGRAGRRLKANACGGLQACTNFRAVGHF